jgi:HTH-type transcriptional regulator / antitoxin HigA
MIKAATSKSKPATVPVDEGYLDLVKQFPLRPLRSRRELAVASRIFDTYIGRNSLSAGERDYIAALVHVVKDYGLFLERFPEVHSAKTV